MNNLTLNLMKILSNIFSGWGVLALGLLIAFWFYRRYTKTKSRQLLNSLPGIFTSMGLLGTFCAICYSLGSEIQSMPTEVTSNIGKTVAEAGLDSSNLDIRDIIYKLIPAFTSSIAGLILAFAATIWLKLVYANEEKQLDEQKEYEDSEITIYRIANLVGTISGQMKADALKNQEYNERLNSNISQQSAILEQFINDFVKRMDEIFVKMKESVESQINNFGEEQFKKSSQVLEQITTKLTNSSELLLTEQKNNVAALISGTQTELTVIASTLKTQMEKLNQDTADALKGIETRHAEEYERIHNESLEGLKKMAALKDDFSKVNGEILNDTIKMNEGITENLRTSLKEFIEKIQSSISEECSTLSQAITINVEALHTSYDFISGHIANIKGNYDASALAFEDAVKNANRMNESSEKMLKTFDASIGSVVETNKAINEVMAILKNRQEEIERLIIHINEISSAIEQLQKLESVLNRIATK
jgi:hypothetical protein